MSHTHGTPDDAAYGRGAEPRPRLDAAHPEYVVDCHTTGSAKHDVIKVSSSDIYIEIDATISVIGTQTRQRSMFHWRVAKQPYHRPQDIVIGHVRRRHAPSYTVTYE